LNVLNLTLTSWFGISLIGGRGRVTFVAYPFLDEDFMSKFIARGALSNYGLN